MTKNILIVDDERAQVRIFSHVLSSNGYKIQKAYSGREAVRIAHESKLDLILLDVIMPEMDGWQTCALIRDMYEVPIIMITGKKNSEEDIVRGLECGADEYISKPIGNRELLARVKAVLRRVDASTQSKHQNIHFSDEFLSINVEERKVIVDGQRARLTPHEFRLLTLLLEKAGQVVSHQQALEHVWGFEYVNDIDYVRIYISHLRQKLEPDPSLPKYILTETGVGYYFCSKS